MAVAVAACSSSDDGVERHERHERHQLERVRDRYAQGHLHGGAREADGRRALREADGGDARAPGEAVERAHVLEVADAAGKPVDGATLSVTPFMPDHGHGSSVKPTVTREGGGTYDVTNVYLPMPGLWRLTVTVQMPTSPRRTWRSRSASMDERAARRGEHSMQRKPPAFVHSRIASAEVVGRHAVEDGGIEILARDEIVEESKSIGRMRTRIVTRSGGGTGQRERLRHRVEERRILRVGGDGGGEQLGLEARGLPEEVRLLVVGAEDLVAQEPEVRIDDARRRPSSSGTTPVEKTCAPAR